MYDEVSESKRERERVAQTGRDKEIRTVHIHLGNFLKTYMKWAKKETV